MNKRQEPDNSKQKRIEVKREQEQLLTTPFDANTHKKTEEEKVELANLKITFKHHNPKHKFKKTYVLGSEEVKVINHE